MVVTARERISNSESYDTFEEVGVSAHHIDYAPASRTLAMIAHECGLEVRALR